MTVRISGGQASWVVTKEDGSTRRYTADLVLVTPEMAREFLRTQARNRPLSEKRVDLIAQDIVADAYHVTGQGATFDEKGHMLDAQHRMAAIVKTGKPALMFLVRGCAPIAQAVIDTGGRRGPADYLGIRGEKGGKERMARARIMELLHTGWNSNCLEVPTQKQIALYDKHKAAVDWSMERLPHSRLVTAPVAAAWAFAWSAVPEVEEFVPSFLDGAGLGKRDPILLLRKTIMESPRNQGGGSYAPPRRALALKTLRAIWAKVNGNTITKLYETPDAGRSFAGLLGDVALMDAWDNWGREAA